MAVVPLADYARGLADGSQFDVEDLERDAKYTYIVWKGVAYKKKKNMHSEPTVLDFHNEKDIKKFNCRNPNHLCIFKDQVWVTHDEGCTWVLWEP